MEGLRSWRSRGLPGGYKWTGAWTAWLGGPEVVSASGGWGSQGHQAGGRGRGGGWSLGPSENVFRKVTVHSDKAEPRARSGEGSRGLGTSE